MKYFIISLLILCPFLVKAQVPGGAFFFEDGKGYDVNGNQTYFCFGDGSCYTVKGEFAFNRNSVNSAPVATSTPVILTPQPVTIINNFYNIPTTTPSTVLTLKPAYTSWAELGNYTHITFSIINNKIWISSGGYGQYLNPNTYTLTQYGLPTVNNMIACDSGVKCEAIFTYHEDGRQDTILPIDFYGN